MYVLCFMKKDNELQKIEWFSFADSYLSVAELICKEIISPKHKENFCNEEKDALSKQNIVTYYIPIVYNLRHSIELFIKGIIFSLDMSVQKEHSIEDLFTILNNQNDNINPLFKMEEYAKLSEMVKKYKNFIEWKEKKSDIVDSENQLNRYPDNKKIDYFNMVYGINDKAIGLICEIREDIRILSTVYFNIKNFLFSV